MTRHPTTRAPSRRRATPGLSLPNLVQPQAGASDPFVQPGLPGYVIKETGLSESVQRAARAIQGLLGERIEANRQEERVRAQSAIGNPETATKIANEIDRLVGSGASPRQIAKGTAAVFESLGITDPSLRVMVLNGIGENAGSLAIQQLTQAVENGEFSQVGGPGLPEFQQALAKANVAGLDSLGGLLGSDLALAGFDETFGIAQAELEAQVLTGQAKATREAAIDVAQTTLVRGTPTLPGLVTLASVSAQDVASNLQSITQIARDRILPFGVNVRDTMLGGVRQAFNALDDNEDRQAFVARIKDLTLPDGSMLFGDKGSSVANGLMLDLEELVEKGADEDRVRSVEMRKINLTDLESKLTKVSETIARDLRRRGAAVSGAGGGNVQKAVQDALDALVLEDPGVIEGLDAADLRALVDNASEEGITQSAKSATAAKDSEDAELERQHGRTDDPNAKAAMRALMGPDARERANQQAQSPAARVRAKDERGRKLTEDLDRIGERLSQFGRDEEVDAVASAVDTFEDTFAGTTFEDEAVAGMALNNGWNVIDRQVDILKKLDRDLRTGAFRAENEVKKLRGNPAAMREKFTESLEALGPRQGDVEAAVLSAEKMLSDAVNRVTVTSRVIAMDAIQSLPDLTEEERLTLQRSVPAWVESRARTRIEEGFRTEEFNLGNIGASDEVIGQEIALEFMGELAPGKEVVRDPAVQEARFRERDFASQKKTNETGLVDTVYIPDSVVRSLGLEFGAEVPAGLIEITQATRDVLSDLTTPEQFEGSIAPKFLRSTSTDRRGLVGMVMLALPESVTPDLRAVEIEMATVFDTFPGEAVPGIQTLQRLFKDGEDVDVVLQRIAAADTANPDLNFSDVPSAVSAIRDNPKASQTFVPVGDGVVVRVARLRNGSETVQLSILVQIPDDLRVGPLAFNPNTNLDSISTQRLRTLLALPDDATEDFVREKARASLQTGKRLTE